MGTQERWFFSKEKLSTTPSRRDGIDMKKELFYRQQAATLIQDMGQKLMVSQLCINSAIVYMHRFYMFHSFSKFHRNLMAPCCLFLACKVEEQPRKLEYLLKVSWSCINKDGPAMDVKSERFRQLYDELVRNENILLATLGFDCSIDHPHTHVVKCCQLIKANRDLAQTSYFMATNSLHLTMMCLQYRSTLVACVCIYLVYKWSGHEIPKSSKGKDWFWYVDKDVSLEQLERVSEEFLLIFNQCSSKLKRKIMNSSIAISDQEAEQMKRQRDGRPRPAPAAASSGSAASAAAASSSSAASAAAAAAASALSATAAAGGTDSAPAAAAITAAKAAAEPAGRAAPLPPSRTETHKIGLRAYKEKKEREKRAHGGGDAGRLAPRAGGGGGADVRHLLHEVDGRHSLLPAPARAARYEPGRARAAEPAAAAAAPAPAPRRPPPPLAGIPPPPPPVCRPLIPPPLPSIAVKVEPGLPPAPEPAKVRPPPPTVKPEQPVSVKTEPVPVKQEPNGLSLASAPSLSSLLLSPLLPTVSPLSRSSEAAVDRPLSPLRFESPPAPPPVHVKSEPAALPPADVKPEPPPATAASIFSPPSSAPRRSASSSSGPELVLSKVDDLPMFSPLKGGAASSIKLPSQMRAVRPPEATAAAAAPPAPPAPAPLRPVATVSAPPSLVGVPVSHHGASSDADRHKHHKEKKKKKKEHKHKKEKKHKDHKEKKKDRHRERDDDSSALRITIPMPKEVLSGGGGAAAAPPAAPPPPDASIPKLTIRLGEAAEATTHKRRRSSAGGDSQSSSRHKHKHKRHRQDSEASDSLLF